MRIPGKDFYAIITDYGGINDIFWIVDIWSNSNIFKYSQSFKSKDKAENWAKEAVNSLLKLNNG